MFQSVEEGQHFTGSILGMGEGQEKISDSGKKICPMCKGLGRLRSVF